MHLEVLLLSICGWGREGSSFANSRGACPGQSHPVLRKPVLQARPQDAPYTGSISPIHCANSLEAPAGVWGQPTACPTSSRLPLLVSPCLLSSPPHTPLLKNDRCQHVRATAGGDRVGEGRGARDQVPCPDTGARCPLSHLWVQTKLHLKPPQLSHHKGSLKLSRHREPQGLGWGQILPCRPQTQGPRHQGRQAAGHHGRGQ